MINKINDEQQKILLDRLARIEGQIRGIQNMISKERECQEIIQQFNAVRSGLQSVTEVYLDTLAQNCLLELSTDPGLQQKKVKELFDLVVKVK